MSYIYEPRDPETWHECNAYCEPPDVHCSVMYSDKPLDPDDVAVVIHGCVYDILRRAPAPEAPDSPSWKVKTLVWTRLRRFAGVDVAVAGSPAAAPK